MTRFELILRESHTTLQNTLSYDSSPVQSESQSTLQDILTLCSYRKIIPIRYLIRLLHLSIIIFNLWPLNSTIPTKASCASVVRTSHKMQSFAIFTAAIGSIFLEVVKANNYTWYSAYFFSKCHYSQGPRPSSPIPSSLLTLHSSKSLVSFPPKLIMQPGLMMTS